MMEKTSPHLYSIVKNNESNFIQDTDNFVKDELSFNEFDDAFMKEDRKHFATSHSKLTTSNLDETIDRFLTEYKEFIESVKLDMVNADEIIKDYPSRKARYTIALERLKTLLSEKKLEQKKLYFELYLKFKRESIEKGFKATEEYLKALIHTSPEYIQFSKEVIELEKKVNVLTACKEALDDLGRMLYLVYGAKINTAI